MRTTTFGTKAVRGCLVLFGAMLFAVAYGALAQGNSPTVSVAISSPAPGAVLEGPATVALTATASVNLANWVILRVEYYSGSSLIGTATAAPYTVQWQGVAPGHYSVTAKAIATNPGQAKQDPATHPNMPTWEGTSAPVAITVDSPPTVSLTAPASGAVFAGPTTIALAADAADQIGVITKVDFYQGPTLIGTSSSVPYGLNWTNVAPGTYTLTAVATNDAGGSTTSAPVNIRVDAPPTASLTAPAQNAILGGPTDIALSASAADTVGTVTKVDFYEGTNLLGTASTAPYSLTWPGVAPGHYTLTAVATNDAGQTGASSVVSITVDAPPVVSLTSPGSGASFSAPATISLGASATDAVGNITRVDFYQGTTLLGTAAAAPYAYSWANVSAGSYTLTAVATNDAGQSTTSPAIAVTVKAALATVYYIEVDQLNTPRVIEDANQRIVWRWDNQEPFGDDTPNEDPGNTGTAFSFPLRFPGQYQDPETNTAYNYYRDYDPAIGRYVQSDPIGLAGGSNTYSYVSLGPLQRADVYALRDVIVAVWTSRYTSGSVGHVYISELNGSVILSSWPDPEGWKEANVMRDWFDTIVSEGRYPDAVYRVHVTNDAAFDQAAQTNRNKPIWDWNPTTTKQTNCTVSAYSALRAGGVPLPLPWEHPYTPNDFNASIRSLIGSDSTVTQLPSVPWR